MPKLFYVYEDKDSGRDAGSKARQDIASILQTMDNWSPILVHRCWGVASLSERISAVPICINDWRHVANTVGGNNILLIQYPIAMFPRVSRLALPWLSILKKHNNKIIMLIHDLDSLRESNSTLESAFLNFADIFIVHNKRMAEKLTQVGYTQPMVSLEIFDYLPPEHFTLPQVRSGIDIAGNLKRDKAQYVYTISQSIPTLEINLYGPNFDDTSVMRERYRGSFLPDELYSVMDGKFGLIWDGDSYETCTGKYGEYIRINNPHKLSLYLSREQPVFIWDQAAEAQFVVNNSLGFSIKSLAEIPLILDQLTQQQYMDLYENVRVMAARLRSGFYTKKAINQALDFV